MISGIDHPNPVISKRRQAKILIDNNPEKPAAGVKSQNGFEVGLPKVKLNTVV